jgi:hypothetical protein
LSSRDGFLSWSRQKSFFSFEISAHTIPMHKGSLLTPIFHSFDLGVKGKGTFLDIFALFNSSLIWKGEKLNGHLNKGLDQSFKHVS